MKQQVIFITGSEAKENFEDFYDYLENKVKYDPYEEKFLNWNKTLGEKLGDEYEYLIVPVKDEARFADYRAWKILFEKMLPYLEDNVIIVATSLGGSFILKYLGENDGLYSEKLEKKVNIQKLFLLAAATRDTPDEILGTFAVDFSKLYLTDRWAEQIYLYHSSDDEIVPLEQSIELKTHFPDAIFRQFHNKGHFYLEERIEELEEDIKS